MEVRHETTNTIPSSTSPVGVVKSISLQELLFPRSVKSQSLVPSRETPSQTNSTATSSSIALATFSLVLFAKVATGYVKNIRNGDQAMLKSSFDIATISNVLFISAAVLSGESFINTANHLGALIATLSVSVGLRVRDGFNLTKEGFKGYFKKLTSLERAAYSLAIPGAIILSSSKLLIGNNLIEKTENLINFLSFVGPVVFTIACLPMVLKNFRRVGIEKESQISTKQLISRSSPWAISAIARSTGLLLATTPQSFYSNIYLSVFTIVALLGSSVYRNYSLLRAVSEQK